MVQLSPRQVAPADLRPHHHRRLGAARAGGHLREETHALAEQRASILKKGLVLHDFPSLKESCLIWWMTVLRTEELMSRCPSTDEPS